MLYIIICFLIFTSYSAVCEEEEVGTYKPCPCCIIDGCSDCLTSNECAFWHCVEDKRITNVSVCEPIPEADEAPLESCIYGGYWAKIEKSVDCPKKDDENSLSGVAIFFIIVGVLLAFACIAYVTYVMVKSRHCHYEEIVDSPCLHNPECRECLNWFYRLPTVFNRVPRNEPSVHYEPASN